MSCPTCDHTMHTLGDHWFWCPRCGTTRGYNADTVEVPDGVKHARAWLLSDYVRATTARRILAALFLHPDERPKFTPAKAETE